MVRPSQLVIDELKVNFIHYPFFFQEQVKNILIKDIKSVVVETIPFFAALKVFWSSLGREPIGSSKGGPEGLIVMDQQKVNMAVMPVAEVVARAEELGRAR